MAVNNLERFNAIKLKFLLIEIETKQKGIKKDWQKKESKNFHLNVCAIHKHRSRK